MAKDVIGDKKKERKCAGRKKKGLLEAEEIPR